MIWGIIGREEEGSRVQRIRDESETKEIPGVERRLEKAAQKETGRECCIKGYSDLAGVYRKKEIQTVPSPE